MALSFRIALLPVLMAAPLVSCGEKGDPARQSLDRIVKAANARDANGVAENLSADFRAEGGEGLEDIKTTLRRYFAAYEILDVKISDVAIERAPAAARATFRADLSGQPRKLGGLEGLLPSASTYTFDVRLVPEGNRWKIAWASWQGPS